MKTLTEFPVMNVKNAAKSRDELLASGKTAEELPQAMGEALKLEGDRLTFMMAALEVVGTKLNDLKRVVVYSVNEGEKVPAGVVQKGNHGFLAEYYPPLVKEKPRSIHESFGPPKGEKGKQKGRKGGRNRDQRSERRPFPATVVSTSAGVEGSGVEESTTKGVVIKTASPGSSPEGATPEGRPRRNPRGPRKPREPRAPRPEPQPTLPPEPAGARTRFVITPRSIPAGEQAANSNQPMGSPKENLSPESNENSVNTSSENRETEASPT